ncbi:Late embryogenesis abundant protein, LEA_1 subgroup [Dillenia turbinata]|uniref:Late embryogenesis abundant protein, LEA_1 subgroup n=1 Tax=Dillenia turbinata TaxID=194707 RepID=A0AAN8WJR2_9MAGN
MASATKEHLTICRAKVEEKAEKAAARTEEKKVMAEKPKKPRPRGSFMQREPSTPTTRGGPSILMPTTLELENPTSSRRW